MRRSLLDTKNLRHVLVLASGGIDSTACIAFHQKRGATVTALFVDYGQAAARRERRAVGQVARHYRIRCTTLKCRSDLKKFGAGLILGRNGFLLLAALMHFPARRGLICLGAHAGTGYYDCSPEFLRVMREVVRAYSQGTIDLSAPFQRCSKSEIIHFAREKLVPLALTYSCELGLSEPCGRCPTCRTLVDLNYYARS